MDYNKMGSLSRANQLIAGNNSQVSIFTLKHWTKEWNEPLGGRPRRSARLERGSTSEPGGAQARARLLLIKIQESVLNYLVQWLLLEESERQDRCSTAARASRQSGTLSARSSGGGGGGGGGRLWSVSSTSGPVANRTPKREQLKPAKKVTRSKLLMKDIAELPDRRDWLSIGKFIFWRWMTWTNVFELALICLLMCCCAYQSYELLDDYFTYPTHVSVTQVLNDDFRADLPSVTICDNNRISLDMLRRNYPELNRSHYLAMSLGTFYSVQNFTLSPASDDDLETIGKNDWMLYGDEITASRLKNKKIPISSTSTKNRTNDNNNNNTREDDHQMLVNHHHDESMAPTPPPTQKLDDINWARVARYLSGNKPSGHFNFLPDYDLVETLLCANVWGEQMPCQRLRRIKTIQQAALCNTFFHDSVFWDTRDPAVKEVEEAMQKRPSTIKFGNQVTGGKLLEFTQADKQVVDEEDETDKNEKLMQVDIANMEMIRIRLNFRRNDYVTKRGMVGGRIAVHSNSLVGEVTHKAYHLKPGFWYNYYVDRFDYQRLPPPYSTQCYDYGASRYVWLDRLKWRQSARAKIHRLIREQANSPNKMINKYVEILRGRSMGKVG